MNGGYIFLPQEMSNYIFNRILYGPATSEKKAGYYITLKEILDSKKPIVSVYTSDNNYTIGYMVGTKTGNNIYLGIVLPVFDRDKLVNMLAGVFVSNNDDVIVTKKNVMEGN